jgi:chromosome segregation protein
VRGLEQRLADADRELGATRASLETARRALDQREREHQEAADELERARQAVAAAREHEAAQRVEARRTTETLAQLDARRDVLEELERERAGLAPAARALLEIRDRMGPEAVLGPLSDYVHASATGARRTERLLADWLNAVLVRDEAAVQAISRWHAEATPGPLLLLPVSPGPALRAAALDGVEAAAPAREWVAALLAGDTPLDAEAQAIRRSSGAVFLPGQESAGGPLARRAELDGLRTESETARRRATALAGAIEAAQQKHEEAERGVSAASAVADRSRAARFEAQAAADDATRHLQRAERERAEAADALGRAHQRLDQRSARLRQIAAEEAAVADERRRSDEELATRRSVLNELDSAQEAARERRVHWQVEEAQVAARATAAEEREIRAHTAREHAEQAILRLDEELAAVDRESLGQAEQRTRWADELAERRVTVQQLQAAVADATAAQAAAGQTLAVEETAVERARDAAMELRERGHRLELAVTELDARRRALVERVEVEWRKPILELLAAAPDVAGDPAALREEAERLSQAIEAMGPVNPLAVDEHAEELKRLEFLTTQRDDLVHARNTLLEAIGEIDATARQMFGDTFAAIRENFGKVFQTLFEGGECDVRLADESDPLGSDIEIRAAPRGKRTQRIHLLSGGERTLVAISLLFAIYLTKPSPFCLLDEVDAPLDDANVARFVRLLDEFKSDTQFIVITHNPRTMQAADAVYGITMQEPGVSTIVGVRLGEVEPV